MIIPRRGALCGALAAAVPLSRARGQDAAVLRLGVLTDLSGPFRDTAGPGAVAGVRLAAEEAQAALPGLRVEVLQADHQNKADVGAGIARQWFDRDDVDAIVDVPNSAVGLAIAGVAQEKDKVFLATGAATTDLTGPRCAPTTVHWTFDTYMLARSTGGALVQAGHDRWFFLVADYALGHSLQRDATGVIEAAKGRVLGAVRYPFPQTTDFSSFLLQAQSSGARVLALANAGADTINAIKQAAEFGLTRPGAGGMRIAAMLIFIGDVHALGLRAAQGLLLTESFYWDLDDRTRDFTRRILPKMRPDWRPNMEHAGSYAGALHYLKAAHALGAAAAKRSGSATVARMKAMPTDDDAFGPGHIREDGRKLHPAHLFMVKSPAESRGPWDYYKRVATTPAEQAARPLGAGGCPMLRT
ncbi:ABC transporter substrate-binding protein [Rhodovastum atsumiense]|uniref:ABC transporter substrate-binding protein n=1 Tax=Rhodovastum atsumiense TaxID=504468 RepID=A0A5M6IQT0_9PROT|nr:ABC transporter substrate-binding protein [Rhodovastum atsumiense]KAA5610632.1 ABC transporter substrate-binding protein [Rhodovastum atsumiense]CAH2600753.1 ABC transporter substrate-binding protein [Rhodovastum atsumiense]